MVALGHHLKLKSEWPSKSRDGHKQAMGSCRWNKPEFHDGLSLQIPPLIVSREIRIYFNRNEALYHSISQRGRQVL